MTSEMFDDWELTALFALAERGLGYYPATSVITGVRAHCRETGQSPYEAFGEPGSFAATVLDTTGRAAPSGGLPAGLGTRPRGPGTRPGGLGTALLALARDRLRGSRRLWYRGTTTGRTRGPMPGPPRIRSVVHVIGVAEPAETYDAVAA